LRVEILHQQDPPATSVIGLTPEVNPTKANITASMSEAGGGTEVVGAGIDEG